MKLKVKRVSGNTNDLPHYQSLGASGFDLSACLSSPLTIFPKGRVIIPTGFAFEIPHGYEIQVRPRSGLAFEYGVIGTLGTIDSDYRGEVMLHLINFGQSSITINNGDRVAQGVLSPVIRASIIEEEELTQTMRGTYGFGSTGI